MWSILTSRLAGPIASGLVLLLIAMLAYTTLTKNAVINKQDKTLETQARTIVTLRGNLAVARGNSASLEAGLHQCNVSAKAAAEQAQRIAQAGVNAVRQVQQAGADSVSAVRRSVQAAPAATCQDAEAILRGDAG